MSYLGYGQAPTPAAPIAASRPCPPGQVWNLDTNTCEGLLPSHPSPPSKAGVSPWLLLGVVGLGAIAIIAMTSKKARRNPRRRRAYRRCPIGMRAQTLIFEKEYFDRRGAKSWARRYGYRSAKIDETADSYRIRQRSPSEFTAGSFRTIGFRPGVKTVLGCPRR